MNKSSTQILYLINLSLDQIIKAFRQILSIIFAFANLGDPVKEIEQESPSDGADTPPGCLSVILQVLLGGKLSNETSNSPAVFKISLAHPKFLSKRFESPFVIHLYLPEARKEIDERLKSDFHNQEPTEHLYDSELTIGRTVQIKLWSPEITFPNPIKKRLASVVNKVSFLGKPNDDCQPGTHWATLVISDAETGDEIHSINYSVQVVDYAFDHVSRPLLSKTMSFILGISSLTMYLLTLLEQIDTTFGFASGTTAGAVAAFVYVRFLSQYQQLAVSLLRADVKRSMLEAN
jgi:hypothetical protein